MMSTTRIDKPSLLENTIGWIGFIVTILAYTLNAWGRISSTGFLYAQMNLLGGLGVGYVALRYGNYQSAFINLIWLIVAIISMMRIVL